MAVRDRIARTAAAKSGGPAAQPFRRPTGRASYPRRMTLDLSDEQYQWLRAQAYEHRVSAAGLVRAALDHIAGNAKALSGVTKAAHRAEHPDL